MNSICANLAAALIHASRTSLEELTIAPPKGFQKSVSVQREHWDATDPSPMHMQNLQTLVLHIRRPFDPEFSVWLFLDEAMGVLDIASTSKSASLDLRFRPSALLQFSDDSDNPSLKLFEQSVARFTSGQTTLSFSTPSPRKNRDMFWTPIFARVFPLLYERGPAREAGQLSLLVLQAVALTARLPVDTAPASMEGHQDMVTDLIVSSDGRFLISTSDDGTIILWDVRRRIITHQWIAHHEGFHIALSPAERRMVSTQGTKMKVWDISDGTAQSTPIEEHTKEGWLGRCFWSPNGEWIAFSESIQPRNPDTAGFFIIHVWNAHTMMEHRVLSQETGSDRSPSSWDLRGFSPDSRLLVWVALDESDPHYCVWKVGTDESPNRVPAVANPYALFGTFSSLSFDPQSKRTVTTHQHPRYEMDLCVRVWDNDTGELLASMAGHSKTVDPASFSPDGRRVLSASMDGTAKVWDAESGVCLLSLGGHEAGVWSAIFSPDGRHIATAFYDRNIRLWRGEDGMCLATFAEHTRGVSHLAFSPDGHTLASGDVDGIVHIRDISGFVQH